MRSITVIPCFTVNHTNRPTPISATRDDPAVLLRAPKDLLRKLQLIAAANGRSRNTEIIARLMASLESDSAAS